MKIKDPALLIAKEETRREAVRTGGNIIMSLLGNPILQMVVAIMAIEVAQQIKFDGKHQLISNTTGSTIETVVISAESIKAIGSGLSSLMPSISGIASLVK